MEAVDRRQGPKSSATSPWATAAAVGAGSVVTRDVPDDSTIVGVPGHLIFRNGKRVVITDPKQINDPLSEALAAVATQVKNLNDRVQTLEGSESDLKAQYALQAIIEMDYQI